MKLTGHSLSFKRGESLIFSEINFSINSGSICFVKGANGSGKSTLMRLLVGFLKSETGSINLDNQDITNNREIRAENFLYLGHENVIKPQLTVIEQILFWQGISQNTYDFESDPMKVSSILRKKLYQCSEGQRRRVALSRLSIEKKRFWFLDEPTVSLDDSNIQLFKESLKDHCNNGGSALIATHDNIGIKPSFEIRLTIKKSLTEQNDPFL